ncbi:cytochrome P450 [Kitasatospora sp. MMS16-BH015]|uniref:cytochrome P450 family protein n=1 Tax=Kitasatospora sp. MMS16-BH015 TaxID=2018025 RepID=UPI000CA1DD6E|nr:cytochrome P450 [Kitasatospora sp. MMS16-BH015]AUG81734.1 cytochrome P450 [Kitasatospora sp. MMS16-BH015]
MSHPLQDPAFFHDPYPTFAALRSSSPVRHLPAADGRSSYLVTGYAEARAAFADPRLSKDTARFFAGRESSRNLHPAVSQSMLATDPPRHHRLRSLAAKAFTPGAVERLRPYIERVAEELLDRWVPGEPTDAIEGFAAPLPVTVICQLLGVPEPDRPAVRAWSNELFAAGRPDRIDAASHAVAEYLAELLAAKRRAPDDSLLTELIRAREGAAQLSEDELVSLAVLLLVAGHETTTNLIGNGLLALLQHPGALRRLREEPALAATAVDELLRYDSPVSTATFRFTTEALTLGGIDIPPGCPVLIAPGAANRDPRHFTAPDQLDLTRDARGHLAFGHGIHRCLGSALARAEGEIAFRACASRFPDLRLAVPATELAWRHTRLMRGLSALPVLPVRRPSS